MREIYLDIIFNYGVLITSIVSLIFFLLFLKRKKDSNQKAAFLLLLLTCLISFEFYPYQITSFPFSIIIPMGIIMLFLMKITKNKYPKFTGVMVVVFSLYLILGLAFLSSSANTWGSGPAPNGIFIVSNSIIILIALFTIEQKNFNLHIICQILIALIGFTLIYYSTGGFHYGEYDGQDVRQRRISSVSVCVISLINSLLILIQKKHLLTKNIVHLAGSTRNDDSNK